MEYLGIEVYCSDPLIHRQRMEERHPDAFGISPPTWREVEEREYHPWLDADLRLDTGILNPEEAVEVVLKKVTNGNSQSHAQGHP